MIAVQTMPHHLAPPGQRPMAIYSGDSFAVKQEQEHHHYGPATSQPPSDAIIHGGSGADHTTQHFAGYHASPPLASGSGWRWHDHPPSGSTLGGYHQPYPAPAGSYHHAPGPYGHPPHSPVSPTLAPALSSHQPFHPPRASTIHHAESFDHPSTGPLGRGAAFPVGPATVVAPNHPNVSVQEHLPMSPTQTHISDVSLDQRPRSAHPTHIPFHQTPYNLPSSLPPLSPWSPHPLYQSPAPGFSPSHAPHYTAPVLAGSPAALLSPTASTPPIPAVYVRNHSISSSSTESQSFPRAQFRPSLSERQQSDEAAYFAKRDTKERPPLHVIERERKAIDWKSLRYTGAQRDVIDELLKMSTKNLKGPEDVPKRPMNAFMIYMSTRRPQIARTNPKNVNGENSKILAREWSWYMPEAEKQYWLDLAEDYREEFKRRFPGYQYRRNGAVSPGAAGPVIPESKKRRLSDPTAGAGGSGVVGDFVHEDESGRRARPGAWRAMSSNEVAGQRWEQTRAPGDVPRSLHRPSTEGTGGSWLHVQGHVHGQHQMGHEYPHSR